MTMHEPVSKNIHCEHVRKSLFFVFLVFSALAINLQTRRLIQTINVIEAKIPQN